MSDIKLFQMRNGQVNELEAQSVAVEKSLQTLIESHLEDLLGIRYLATEYSTGKKHAGRIDTLGIDENGYPVIIEYKRAINQNVINQGLYYLDWLMDHKGEFTLLVMNKLGRDVADTIEWSSPRLICIAGDYTKYDEYAVEQINRNIELMRYRKYGDQLLLLELVNVTQVDEAVPQETSSRTPSKTYYKSQQDYYAQAPQGVKDLFDALSEFLLALGDDVQRKWLKYYVAFRRIRNFATVTIHPQAQKLLVYVPLDPGALEIEEGFTRDVRDIGHHGIGDLEITIQSEVDLERARALLVKSYEAS